LVFIISMIHNKARILLSNVTGKEMIYSLLIPWTSTLASDKSIGLFLRYAFTSRYKEVLSKSHSSSMMAVPKFVPRLTKEETRVFESARESMAAFKKWRAGGVRLHKASILGRKRKTKLPDGASTPWTYRFKVSMEWSTWAVYLICSSMFTNGVL